MRTGRIAASFAVLGGGAAGAAARAAVDLAFEGALFPTATLTVNIAGAFFIGLYLGRPNAPTPPRPAFYFWAVGMLGALTTFSAFSLEVLQMLEGGRVGTALIYVVASLVGGLAAADTGNRLATVIP